MTALEIAVAAWCGIAIALASGWARGARALHRTPRRQP